LLSASRYNSSSLDMPSTFTVVEKLAEMSVKNDTSGSVDD